MSYLSQRLKETKNFKRVNLKYFKLSLILTLLCFDRWSGENIVCYIIIESVQWRETGSHIFLTVCEQLLHQDLGWSNTKYVLPRTLTQIYCWAFTGVQYCATTKCGRSADFLSRQLLDVVLHLNVYAWLLFDEVCRHTKTGRGPAPYPHSAISFHRREFG